MIISPNLYYLIVFGALITINYSKRQWVDHTDMLHYDPHSKKMVFDDEKQQETTTNSETGEKMNDNNDCCLKIAQYKAMFETCQKEKENESICDVDSDGHSAYLKRFVAKILQQFSYQSQDETEEQRFEIVIKLRSSDKQILENFVYSENVRIQDVDAVVSELFVKSYPMTDTGEYVPFAWLKPEFQAMLPYLLVLAAIFCFSRFTFKNSVIFVFVLSVYWHWKHMYEEAVVARHIEVTKNPSVPSECLPEKMTFWSSVFNWWSVQQLKNQDVCEKYFKIIMVDPFWDVSPSMAVAQTIAAFITSPFGLIGKNLGLFFLNFYRELPLWVFYSIVPLMMMFFILIFAMCFNYRVKLPGFVAIEPGHDRREVIRDNPRLYLRDQHEEVKINERNERYTCGNEESRPRVTYGGGGGDGVHANNEANRSCIKECKRVSEATSLKSSQTDESLTKKETIDESLIDKQIGTEKENENGVVRELDETGDHCDL